MARIDAAALACGPGRSRASSPRPGAASTFMDQVLDWHAEGEEEAVFTALEGIAPRLAWTYDRDHRGLDAAFAEFTRPHVAARPGADRRGAIRRLRLPPRNTSAPGAGEDAQVSPGASSAALSPEPSRATSSARLSGRVPRDRFPEVVAWLFPLVGARRPRDHGRASTSARSPPRSSPACMGLVRGAIGGDEYAALAAAVPGLPARAVRTEPLGALAADRLRHQFSAAGRSRRKDQHDVASPRHTRPPVTTAMRCPLADVDRWIPGPTDQQAGLPRRTVRHRSLGSSIAP